MSASMTYSQLISDIALYADRRDSPFITQLPRFVMMAENRIASEVRGLGLLQLVNGTLQAGVTTLAKPAGWRETAGFMVKLTEGPRFLRQRGYFYCREYWPDTTIHGQPLFYSDYDYEHFYIVPASEVAVDFELMYHERPAPLSDSNQTNWTTQYAPQLLLYACLLEAQVFLKNRDKVPEYQALYDRASAAVTSESQRRLNGDQSLVRTIA